MNIILGTNNKQVDKYVSSMDNITVLTQVRKREQIIDRVIDLNPHAILIAKTLAGKIGFYDVFKRLRDLKPNLKIIFLYGEKDEEYRLFLDRLISLHIYNFLAGSMDELELEDVILRDYTLEDVSSYQISQQEELALPRPEPEDHPKPAKEYHIEKEPEIDVMVVEKVIERERIETEVIGNIRIAVGSLFARAGCTHMSLDLAYYLSKQKKDIGVIVSPQIYDSLTSYYIIDGEDCVIKGVHIYRDEIKALNNHKTVIYDFGRLHDDNIQRFYEANLKIMISPVGHWEIDVLTDFLRNTDYVTQIEFVLYPVSAGYFRELEHNLAKGKARAYMLQYSPKIFDKCLLNSGNYDKILRRIFTSL